MIQLPFQSFFSQWILPFLIAIPIALFLKTFFFTFVWVKGKSMEDTLLSGSLLFVTKFEHFFTLPKRHQIVLCRFPNRKEYFIKRIIGLPNETIAFVYDDLSKQNITLINNDPLNEPYLSPKRNGFPREKDALLLEEKNYFVAGDNRISSNDSRNPQVGPLSQKQVVGTVRFVLFPFSRLGKIS
ncbi:MAG: signal peptidase I [Clostridiales bacterium]|nr:signal peptidase I [Clostridiales bacterium]